MRPLHPPQSCEVMSGGTAAGTTAAPEMENPERCASPHPCQDKFFMRVLLKVNEQDEIAYWAGENTYQRQR